MKSIVSFSYFLKKYSSIYGKSIGEISKEESVNKIMEHMSEIDVKCKAAVVDGMLCAAFITPMMERVAQKVETCKELLFLDTSGTMDRYGHYVVLIMCKGKTGGLPVGVLILDSQTEEAYTNGLKMFKSIYSDQKGPKVERERS